jgi:hypothetical protein
MIWDTSIWSRKPCRHRQSVRHEIVTHVLDTFCHPCLRVGQPMSPGRTTKVWCRWTDSNRRPTHYEEWLFQGISVVCIFESVKPASKDQVLGGVLSNPPNVMCTTLYSLSSTRPAPPALARRLSVPRVRIPPAPPVSRCETPVLSSLRRLCRCFRGLARSVAHFSVSESAN